MSNLELTANEANNLTLQTNITITKNLLTSTYRLIRLSIESGQFGIYDVFSKLNILIHLDYSIVKTISDKLIDNGYTVTLGVIDESHVMSITWDQPNTINLKNHNDD